MKGKDFAPFAVNKSELIMKESEFWVKEKEAQGVNFDMCLPFAISLRANLHADHLQWNTFSFIENIGIGSSQCILHFLLGFSILAPKRSALWRFVTSSTKYGDLGDES